MRHPEANASDAPPALQVDSLTRRYGALTVLHDVGMAVAAGTVTAVLGPSGSGKSTLLRLVAGLEPRDAGRVRVAGRDVTALPAHRRGVGLVFQDHALFPHLDVRANVAFGLVEAGWSQSQIVARVDALLDDLGLAALGERRVDALSGGERQRVALARALAPRPHVLLLDEPLASLDRALRERLADDLAERLRQADLASVLVTHDLDEAGTVADDLVLLDGGVVKQRGSVAAIVDAPADAWVARFLGHPNVFEGAERTRLPRPGSGPLWLRDELITLVAADAVAGPSGPDAEITRLRHQRGGMRLDLWVAAWGVRVVWRGAVRDLPVQAGPGDRVRLAVPERAWRDLPAALRPTAHAPEVAA
ncbi:MAG: ABC transporter ATP-binding protein [Trueperaceae bacterium]|nr:MAG: ABC transporter ATP-binding protein [Trueperaceae bacterium]